MKLITKEIEKKLLANDGKEFNGKFVCKFFGGSACTWLIWSAEKVGNDLFLYGKATLGFEWEWGTVSFNELKGLKFKPFGLGVERDLYYDGKDESIGR